MLVISKNIDSKIKKYLNFGEIEMFIQIVSNILYYL